MPVSELQTSLTLLAKVCDPRNEEAWQRFMKRYHGLIYGHALRLLGNQADAEDISGEVLLKIARKLPDFHYDPAKSFRGWLSTVVRNACRDWQRRQARTPRCRQLADADWRNFPDSASLEKAKERDSMLIEGITEDIHRTLENDLGIVRQALKAVQERVKPQRWQAYWATAMEGRKAAEVARELGLKVNDVFVAKHQIGKVLRQQILALGGCADAHK
jgi:RNA polymerase sigma-70 factor (ECF subfamily)